MGVWNGMGMGMGWAWVFMVLLIVGIVLLVVALVRGLGGTESRPPGADPSQGHARAILDERYARGEIDTTEYQERLRELGGR